MTDRKPNDEIPNTRQWAELAAVLFIFLVVMMAPVWDAEALQGESVRAVNLLVE